MAKVTNVSGRGELEIPLPDKILVCPEGESIEVDAELAKRLCEQPSNWQPAKTEPKTKAG